MEINHKNLKDNFIKGADALSRRDATFKSIREKVGIITFEPKILNFQSFCRIIIGQQLSSKAATTIFSRFEQLFSEEIISERFLSFNEHHMKNIGVSRQKFRYMKNLALMQEKDPDLFEKLKNWRSDKAHRFLISLDGIGPWTSGIIRLFYLGDLNVFPIGDVSLEKVYKVMYGSELSKKTPNSYGRIDWASPYKGVLALYFWDYLDGGFLDQEVQLNIEDQ